MKSLFTLAETAEITDLDAPETTMIHRRVIKKKPFLKHIYDSFYRTCKREIGGTEDDVIVEIGSGPGFIKEHIPHAITTDILELPHVDKCFSALSMPFDDASVDAFTMINVFHHIPDPERFLSEMYRCLKPGGRIVMIEPANTLWSRFIFRNFHHEPFEPSSSSWNFPEGGPLSSANGALPWIVFKRDRKRFTELFPGLALKKFHIHTPMRYLLSGGLTLKQLLPSALYTAVASLEKLLSPFRRLIGMFVTITLTKNDHA